MYTLRFWIARTQCRKNWSWLSTWALIHKWISLIEWIRISFSVDFFPFMYIRTLDLIDIHIKVYIIRLSSVIKYNFITEFSLIICHINFAAVLQETSWEKLVIYNGFRLNWRWDWGCLESCSPFLRPKNIWKVSAIRSFVASVWQAFFLFIVVQIELVNVRWEASSSQNTFSSA